MGLIRKRGRPKKEPEMLEAGVVGSDGVHLSQPKESVAPVELRVPEQPEQKQESEQVDITELLLRQLEINTEEMIRHTIEYERMIADNKRLLRSVE